MKESDAFSFIQKSAMTQRTTMRAIAESILKGELVPPA
jgi:AmiR/NasT family two-component response regulator